MKPSRKALIARDRICVIAPIPTNTRIFDRIRTASKEYSNTPRGLTLNRIELDWRAVMQSTCKVPECERATERAKHGVCEMHYYRFRRNGTYDLKARDSYKVPVRASTGNPVSGHCGVEECTRTANALVGPMRVCGMHWKRHRRNEHFNYTRRWSATNTSPTKCAVSGCSSYEDGACGYCKMHQTRINRHGDANHCVAPEDRNFPRGPDHYGWTGDDATYRGMHRRVYKARGAASEHSCCECGGTAAQWAYDHRDPNQRVSECGAYSLSIERYQPMCVQCHKRFDMERIMRARP